MNKQGQERLAEIFHFVLVLRREAAPTWNVQGTGWELALRAADLVRLAGQYQAIQVARCNRDLTGREEGREVNIVKQVRELLLGSEIEPRFSGDPRGCCLKLELPSGRSNSFGGEGWLVPRLEGGRV